MLLPNEGLCCPNLGMLIGFQRIRQVRQRAPLFFTPKNSQSRLTPEFIIYSYSVLSGKERKMSQLFNNNYNSFNTYINPTVADDQPNILAWLSPLDQKLRHQDIRDRRVGNIGEWILQTEEFRSWYAGGEGGESNNAVLFCHGNPGVGKTYIW